MITMYNIAMVSFYDIYILMSTTKTPVLEAEIACQNK